MLDINYDDRTWENPNRWPDDAVEYVFLARAISQIAAITNEDVAEANPAASSGDAYANDGGAEDQQEITDEGLLLKRRRAIDVFVKACKAGQLLCATRRKLGGSFEELPSSVWNTEAYKHWFHSCEISIKSPYVENEFDDKHWLFVEAKSLRAFRGSMPEGGHQTKSEQHLSPYLRLMIDVVTDWHISPGTQPTIAALVAEFQDRWRRQRGDDLSARLAKAMASLVREEESRTGNAPGSKRKNDGLNP